jgi:hypothetical protein
MRVVPARTPAARAVLLAVSLAACAPDGRSSAPAARPVATGRPAPSARPAVRSCPADARPLAVDFDPRIVLGEAAGITWLFGAASGDGVLAHLGPDGALALTRVPLHDAQVGAVAGARIWLYAPRESDAVPTRWTSVDIRDPDAPIPGPVVPVKVGAKFDAATLLAVGTRRALIITGVPDDRELVLLDPLTNAAIAPPHALGRGFAPVHAFCEVERCAVVGVTDEGGGPARRLVVIRTLADGTREQELLAPGWIGQPHAGRHDDHVIVTWTDRDGLRLRALDQGGRLAGPTLAVPWDSRRTLRNDTLLHADGAVMIALGERGRWSVASVGPKRTPGAFRELPGAAGHLLVGAPLDDGLAWVDIDGEVTYDEIGDGIMAHWWRSRAVGGFLPAADGAATQIDLAAGAGDGRGGLQAFMLTRPGAAAALVVPRGDAISFHKPVFTPLRLPCPT